MDKRASVGLLPFGFDIEITRLSAMKSVEETLSANEEARQVAEALQEIRAVARWLFLSRPATGHQFRFVSTEDSDVIATELGLNPGALPTAEQLAEFRRRLGADWVVAGNILDYGLIRWYLMKPIHFLIRTIWCDWPRAPSSPLMRSISAQIGGCV